MHAKHLLFRNRTTKIKQQPAETSPVSTEFLQTQITEKFADAYNQDLNCSFSPKKGAQLNPVIDKDQSPTHNNISTFTRERDPSQLTMIQESHDKDLVKLRMMDPSHFLVERRPTEQRGLVLQPSSVRDMQLLEQISQ